MVFWYGAFGSLASLALLFHAVAADVDPFCDADCQLSYRQALAIESKRWVSNNVATDEFYASPNNISAYAAGDLVKWQDLSPSQISQNWTIPAGMSLSRYLYMSEDIEGKAIPATAFVLIPYSNPLKDKPFRAVVWAHGTAGGTRQCAPTNHRALYYEWEGPFALAQRGYVVIAPDYAGLGSDIPQGFMYEAGALHAADVGLGVKAARQRLGKLISHEWVIVGHSEGGLTAWRTNEREAIAAKATGGFIGAVSAAPALRPLSLIPESFRLANGGPVGDVVSIYFLQSLSRLFDTVRIGDYVSDIVANRIPLADQGCLITGGALYGNLTQDQLYKNISWLNHPVVVDWQKRYNGAGPHELAAPMLIVQGVNDTLTYPETMEDDLNQTCGTYPNSTVDLLLYPELDHDETFQAAQADYLPWIEDRFNNLQLTVGCNKRTVSPATNRFSITQQSWDAVVQLE